MGPDDAEREMTLGTSLAQALADIGLADPGARSGGRGPSTKRFSSGASWRVEIPSVEGPDALRAVLEESQALGVTVHRVSQGSGIALLTDRELGQMATLGRAAGVEVVLWAGLRAAWDTSAQARTPSGSTGAAAVKAWSGVVAAVEEAVRAAEAGIDGVLVADVGVLAALGQAKQAGSLPSSFVLKTSLALPTFNPKTAAVYESLGATSLNLPTDLSVREIAEIRAAVDVPLDCYIEGADDFGAPLRYHEIAEIVAAAAPVHLKFGLRNAPNVYPSGGHLSQAVVAASRERVRRAALGVAQLCRRGGGVGGEAGPVLSRPVLG